MTLPLTKCTADSCPQNKKCVRYNITEQRDMNHFDYRNGKCDYFVPAAELKNETKAQQEISTYTKKSEETTKKTKSYSIEKPLI